MLATTLEPADGTFLDRLARLLPPDRLRPAGPADLEEPRNLWPGRPGGAVALPRSAEEVAIIVRAAAAARVGLVPQGGLTGLVGGQTLPDGPLPLLVSLARMDRIREIRPEEYVMITEAGAILETVQQAAESRGRLFPLSLAAQGTARIGGCLATNAGGVNVLRYGNARELCLGVEAVLPDGTIWNGMKRLRKDNTGYDLRGLLIGSEGTLGIITAAVLKLFPRPPVTGTAMLAVASPAAALNLLALARDRVGEGISAFELMHREGFNFLAEAMPDLRPPMEPMPEWSVLIDLGLGQGADAAALLEEIFAEAAERGLVEDGVIAASEGQRQHLWKLRESIPEANRHVGAISSHDISLPLSSVAVFIERAGAALAAMSDVRINCFGHLGDGNLHYNLFPAVGKSRGDYAGQRAALADTVYGLVAELGGSFSAEHGVGRARVADLERWGEPAKLAAMRAVKAALDPRGIMNPGAMLR